jgi:hypothetical protein
MAYTTRHRICVTADGSRAVTEDDAEATYLLAPAGGKVEDAVAERLGLPDFEKYLEAAAAAPAPTEDEGSDGTGESPDEDKPEETAAQRKARERAERKAAEDAAKAAEKA